MVQLEIKVEAPDGVSTSGGSDTQAMARWKQRIVPLAIAGLLVVVVVLILREIPSYRETNTGEPGPAAMPILVSVLSLTTAAGLAIQTLRGKYDPDPARFGNTTRVSFGAVALLCIPVLMPYIGSLLTFALAITAISILAGSRRPWLAAVVGLGASWAVLFVFRTLLSVPFPKSIIDTIVGL